MEKTGYITVHDIMNKRALGTAYEQIAGRYLESQGYQILEYNYRCRLGEIDLIALDGEYLVFCEVKYRAGAGSGDPLEAVDGRKQKIIWRVAQQYLLHRHVGDVPCRFDVIGIQGEKITLMKNAFEG